MRRLDLVIGPNGAGKSTFVGKTLSRALPAGIPFVNADVIAAQRWPQAQAEHAYEAAQIAAATRVAMIKAGGSFIAETVFSHPSKLDVIAAAQLEGYTVFLHVVMVPEDLSVARVAHRVSAGGHAVPEHKIRERHRRLWPLVRTAALRADTTTFYDNTARSGPQILAQLTFGVPVGRVRWPAWADQHLTKTWLATESDADGGARRISD
ncbi:AAA family ATPase [Marmoricola sp. RAF53]|uniref:AAA family ATPase n=1 Tax=Marmoricola sp. RAF53 TaxID=3233059 RepID=UPI003F9695EB